MLSLAVVSKTKPVIGIDELSFASVRIMCEGCKIPEISILTE